MVPQYQVPLPGRPHTRGRDAAALVASPTKTVKRRTMKTRIVFDGEFWFW
jgi:hypothetical protein